MNEMWNRNERPQRRRPPAAGQRGGMALNNQNRSDGNAHRNYVRYIALAKEAASRGDTIEAENCHQHAEHYFRTMREGEKGRRD